MTRQMCYTEPKYIFCSLGLLRDTLIGIGKKIKETPTKHHREICSCFNLLPPKYFPDQWFGWKSTLI